MEEIFNYYKETMNYYGNQFITIGIRTFTIKVLITNKMYENLIGVCILI